MQAVLPRLQAGKVYRTSDLEKWGSNPTRLAKRLVREGQLQKLQNGLYYRPRRSSFGPVPPRSEELLRAFFSGSPYLVTGSARWNELGLGVTTVLAYPIVYNTTRTGLVRIGKRQFLLRRVRFPKKPLREWFAVDLLENHGLAGVSLQELEEGLRRSLRAGRLDGLHLQEMAERYGTRRTQEIVERVRGSLTS